MEFYTNCLSDALDKHNSTMVKAWSLIISLFDVTSVQEMPCGTPMD